MKSFRKLIRGFLIALCCLISLGYIIYFNFGHQFEYEFANRCWAYSFTDILVFSTAASLYLLFILSINNSFKWWENLLLILSGLLVSLIPIVIYHAHYKLYCGFWNQQRIKTEVIAVNKWSKFKTVEIHTNKCVVTGFIKKDTVLVDNFNPYFNEIKPASQKTLQSGSWILLADKK